MATTTNFGWETPDDTDLVKDGALAMRTLGNAIDASMVDLKGGTTGQVLSKASNTDMDFTWVAQDDSNAIQNAIVDAKGDLIAASAADTPARLAVGNNGETLVADSSASTGLRWQSNFAAGKNKVVNGDFSIWQRGTSVTPAVGYGYTADRWRSYSYSSNTTTVSRQTFTAGAAPVAGYEGQYFARINSTTGNTYIGQPIENVQTLAGQTVTVSFWAKAASAISGTGQVALEQYFGSGGSSTVITILGTNLSFTTSWVRYSYTTTLPSISGKTIGSNSYLELVLSFGVTNNAVDLWGLQVEAGNTATAFQTATGTLAGELAAAQRYYWRQSGENYNAYGSGISRSATVAAIYVPFPVPMRVKPTSVDYSTLQITDLDSYGLAVTALTLATDEYGTQMARVNVTSNTGATGYRPAFLRNANSGAGYLGFSAEL